MNIVYQYFQKVEEKEDFLPEIRKRQEKLKNSLIIKDFGLTVHTKSTGILSAGCEACKAGTWHCIFVNNNCNLRCPHCPQAMSDVLLHPRSVNGEWIDDVRLFIDFFRYSGVSYSGGEPILALPKVIEIAEYVLKNHSDIYQWIYSNGDKLTEDIAKRLIDCGIVEIRLDLLATNFAKRVVEKIDWLQKIFKRVTIEVPSTKETKKQLIDNKIIHLLADKGISQLNLAELYICEENYNAFSSSEKVYLYNSNYTSNIAPIFSRKITYDIIEYVVDNSIDLLINDCSMDAKLLQYVMGVKNRGTLNKC